MKLLVADVLKMEAFSRFELVAGHKGLNREIRTVGMLDYELGDMVNKNFGPGELVVTTLVAIKDDLNALEDIVKRLIQSKTAGLAIKTIYLDQVSEKIKAICDEAQYPIFLFDETFFERLITAVNDALKAQDEQDDIENQVDRLLTGDMNKYGIRRAALGIHRSFSEQVTVAYVQDMSPMGEIKPDEPLMYQINSIARSMRCLFYRKGYLLIASGEEANKGRLEADLRMGLLKLENGNRFVGLSEKALKLDKLDVAIHQGIFACEAARRYGIVKLNFMEIGADRLLMPIKDNPWVMAFYESVIEPLEVYDQKNGTDLLKTAIVYVLSEGDIKAAAGRLFQHGNTVRYRMERIRHIVEEGLASGPSSAWSFYEVLSFAIRLHLIYTGDTVKSAIF